MIIVTTKEETNLLFDKFDQLLEEISKPGKPVKKKEVNKLIEEFSQLRSSIGLVKESYVKPTINNTERIHKTNT